MLSSKIPAPERAAHRRVVRPAAWLAAAIIVALGAAGLSWSPDATPPASDALAHSMLAALRASDARFARPASPFDFAFPADHAAHPEFRSDYWRVAAHLVDERGEPLDVQLAIARIAIAETSGRSRTSAWAAYNVYVAELLALGGEPEVSAERIARGTLGLSGHSHDPLRVWVGNWSLSPGAPGAPWRLSARQEGVSLELGLAPAKPPVLPAAGGEGGRAPPFVGYALTRLEANGSVLDARGKRRVSGQAWIEHGFGDLPLPGGPVAIDRWRLQLDDGRELSLNTVRRLDGRGDPRTSGLLVERDGAWRALAGGDLSFEATSHWRPAAGARRYPVRWRLTAPGAGVALELRAPTPARLGSGSASRWTGPVDVYPAGGGSSAVGRGFAESWGEARS